MSSREYKQGVEDGRGNETNLQVVVTRWRGGRGNKKKGGEVRW